MKEAQREHRIIMEMSNQNDLNCEGHECYVIDVETTGLDSQHDEILQLSIINDKGEIVFDSFFKPCANSWDEAQQVNQISPEMVESAPSFAAKVAEINAILRNTDRIIGYKVEHKDDNFANAREIRNLFEGIITNQATRVAEIDEPTDEQLNTIEKADMEEFLAGIGEEDAEKSDTEEDIAD